jgi:hypothetical protein
LPPPLTAVVPQISPSSRRGSGCKSNLLLPAFDAIAAPASPPGSENSEPLVNCARSMLSNVGCAVAVVPVKL